MRLALAALGLAVWAGVLVLAPQRLATEVSGRSPRWARSALAIALSTGLGVALLLAPLGDLPRRVVLAACLQCALALAWIDGRWLVIPDLYVVAFGVAALVGPLALDWPRALAGALVGGGLLWAVRWFWRWRTGAEGLGFGDVKLATALGALLGPEATAQVIAAAALLGALALALTRRRRGVAPLGACLALAAVARLGWER